MFAIHIRSSRLYDIIPHPRAWMYWAVNRERRGLMPSVNGRDEFTFHTQLKPDEKPEQITDAQAKVMFQAALGANLDVEIVARSTWNAGYTLVAEKFRRGRIFLGGDAAHLFTPTGGLGYNTAVEDAVNLGWKLAAVIKGWGGPGLLASYETERQAIARRNTACARGFADGRVVRSTCGTGGRQSRRPSLGAEIRLSMLSPCCAKHPATADVTINPDVRFWPKADMSGSGLLPCKLTLNPISPVANPCCNYVLFGVVPPWAGNATTRFHQSNCWISHCMADRRSRAADQKVANRRFYGRGHVSRSTVSGSMRFWNASTSTAGRKAAP